MSRLPKPPKVIKDKKPITTLILGNYTGNSLYKTFGRLDCEFGMHMAETNRVYFATWKDAIDSKYTPCRKCNPQPADKYPEQEVLKEELLAKPHIALWKTDPPTDHNKSSQGWYACLNWQDKGAKKGKYRQIKLSDTFVFLPAQTIALSLGRKCNLPVLQHNAEDFIVIAIPVERTTDIEIARDKQALKELLKSKNTGWFRSKK